MIVANAVDSVTDQLRMFGEPYTGAESYNNLKGRLGAILTYDPDNGIGYGATVFISGGAFSFSGPGASNTAYSAFCCSAPTLTLPPTLPQYVTVYEGVD